MIAFSDWSCQGFLNSPVVSNQSAVKRSRKNTKTVGPFSDCLGFTVEGNDLISSSIAKLFRTCGPSTIIWRIRAIVVDPIKRMLGRWSRPHVSVEVLESIPSVANNNSTPSPVVIVPKARIIAALFHVSPDAVFCCLVHIMRFDSIRRNFFLQASTAFRVSSNEVLRLNDNLCSAIAKTIPVGQTGLAMREGNYLKPIEAQSRVVFHDVIVSQIVPDCNIQHGRFVT